MESIDVLWDRCRTFHGHTCGGLLTGFAAAVYASRILSLETCDNEQNVCISENDACGVDAIQVVLGCTVGRGNLLFHITGKTAYSFYRRADGKSVRIVLSRTLPPLEGESIVDYLEKHDPSEYFTVKETKLPLSAHARIYESFICDKCGERTGTAWMNMRNGQRLCPDCYGEKNDD